MEHLRDLIHGQLKRALTPLARLLIRVHVNANQVSITGVLLNIVVTGLVATDYLTFAGIVFLAAGFLDVLDGVIARLTKRESPFGAFLDSTLDRVSEGVVLSAVAYRFALEGNAVDAALVLLALLGSLLVSYTRARAEGLGAECKVGVATRAERVLLLAAGMITGLLALAVYLLIALSAITVSQRIARTFRQLAPKG